MTASTCGLFEDCLAPLCPLDKSSLKGVWYSDEGICRSRTHGNLSWIRSQRKIARVKAGGYFTLEMLNDIRTARKGMMGLDPNEDEKTQLKRWLGLHEKKRSASPQTGVSAPVQNVAKQAGQGKNLCRNGGSQHPNRIGTGNPLSRRFATKKT